MTDGNSRTNADDFAGTSNRVLKRVLELDTRHVDRLFALMLTLFMGAILYLTSQYGWSSQIFPLVIGVPTFAFLVVVLVIQFSPRVGALARKYSNDQVIGNAKEMESRLDQEQGTDEDSLATKRWRILLISAWIVALVGLILLVGFLPAILFFMVAYFRFGAEQNWQRSIILAMVAWLLVVIVFDIILETPFFEGILEVRLPILN